MLCFRRRGTLFGISATKAQGKSLGFSFQDPSNFISMPSFCCHYKKTPLHLRTKQSSQIRGILPSSSDNTHKNPSLLTAPPSPAKSKSLKTPNSGNKAALRLHLYPSLVFPISSLFNALVNLVQWLIPFKRVKFTQGKKPSVFESHLIPSWFSLNHYSV